MTQRRVTVWWHAVQQICKTKWKSVIHYWCLQSWLSLFTDEGNYLLLLLSLHTWLSFEGVLCCAMLHSKAQTLAGCVNGTRCSDLSPVALQVASCRRQWGLWLKLLPFFSRHICHSTAPYRVQDDRLDMTFSCMTLAIGYMCGYNEGVQQGLGFTANKSFGICWKIAHKIF